MTDTNISDAVVFPEDDGTGVPDGSEDYNSAGHFGLLSQHQGGTYVGNGLGFTNIDTTNETVDITTGHAFVEFSSVTVQSGSGTTYDTTLPDAIVMTIVLPSSITLSLDTDATNDVYLATDPTTQDGAYLRHGSAVSEPTDPSVLLGTVNTADGSTTRASDNASPTFDTVTSKSVNTEAIQYALNNTGFSGRLSDRPLVSDSETILTVGTDTATIQEALNEIPLLLRHNFEIQVPDGSYDENLLVPPFTVADSAGLARDDTTREGATHLPRITGNISNPTNVEVNSWTITGAQGAIAPLIEGFNVTGISPHADESAAIDVFGCQNVSFRWMSMANATATVGFVPYGSGVTIRQECHLGIDVLQHGIETKHNANVNIDSFDSAGYGLDGSATEYAVFNNDGSVLTLGYSEDSPDMIATGGTKDVFNREGLIFNAEYQEYEPVVGCRAESTVVDQTITSGQATGVEFDTTAWDRTDSWDGTNNIFEVPERGRYSVQAQVQWLAPADSTELNMQVFEGTTPKVVAASRLGGSVTTNPTQQISTTALLSEGDELALRVEQDEGSDVSINTDKGTLTHMEINRIT